MMLYNIEEQIRNTEQRITELKEQISRLPDGSLRISKQRKYYSYSQKPSNGPPRYLHKSERSTAKALAFKRYLTLQLKELETYRNALLKFQQTYAKDQGLARRFLLENEGAWLLLKDSFPFNSAPSSLWASRPESTSAPNQKARIIKCRSGHMVRSKSEGMIDNTLLAARADFRYEEPLVLGDITIHPDFTIRHPVTGSMLYWEHFGMMDIPKYSLQAAERLDLYVRHGFIPFHNLIITFESSQHPLSYEQIDLMMDYFF